MTTSELLEFIRIEHALGMNLDEITRLLIDEGEWDAADVAEAFRALGLPEDAVERYTMKAAGIVPPPVRAPLVEPAPLPPPAVAPVVRHAPPPQPIAGPRDMEYVKHAAPMQYVEKPEPKPVPVLARPATLVGQGARPLVRTTTQPSSMTAAPLHAVRPGQAAGTVHISRVQQPQQKPAPVHIPAPAPLPATKPAAPAPLAPVKFTFVPSTKEAAPVAKPITPTVPTLAPAPQEVPKVAVVAAPVHAATASLQKPVTPVLPHEAPSSLGFEIGGGSAPVYQPKRPEAAPLPTPTPEKKVIAPAVHEAPLEKPKFTPPPAPAMPAPAPKPVAPTAPLAKPVEAPKPIEPPKPIEQPKPTPPPQPIETPKPIEEPKPVEAPKSVAPPVPVVAPIAPPAPAPVAPTPPPPPPPTTLQPIFITMPTFGPEQIQAMQQQYMGMMGGAPMGAGLQPAVAPTIIYNQTVAPPPPPPTIAAPLAPLTPPLPLEPKKPEPIRFDIGRVRDTRKMEQSISGGKPSILAAVSGMQPVGSTNIEDVFKSQMGGETTEDLAVEKSAIVHSLKVPHKRTMAGDLVRMQEGIMPEQVVSQTVKTTAIAGVALPDVHPGQSGPQSGLPSPETMVDDMPIPPPPKKSGKPITLITFSVLGILAASGLAAYYFLFYRLPPAADIYKSAVTQLLITPGVTYNASLSIEATSTEAEPELIRAQAMASGTVYMKKNAFGDGTHTLKFNLMQVGAPQPITIAFDGDVRVVGNDVYVKQNSPTLNTPLADLLSENSWIKIPFTQLGLAFGLVGSSTVTQGDYAAITPAASLSNMLSVNAPLRVVGSVEKFTRDDREYYRVPLILDSGKAVGMDELLGNYLRGSSSVKNSADRVAQLTERFKNVTGEIIVDKLLLRPIALSLSANYDPSKIALAGSVRLNMSFKYVPARAVAIPEGNTLDELRALRAGEAGAQEIIARDAPARSMISIITLALGQYAEKSKRYPTSLLTLVANNFISKDALTPEILNRIVYVAYVNKPTNGNDGVHCTDKNPVCNFYHIGTTLEYKNSSELQSDADYTSPAISGGDSAGCVNEVDRSCYDMVGNLTNGAAAIAAPETTLPAPLGTTTKPKIP